MHEVSPMQRHELDDAIATASRAFWPDPLFGYFARTSVDEHRALPLLLGALVRDGADHGEVWVARHAGRVVGSATWCPPGSLPRSRRREMRIQIACARALVNGTNRLTGMRLLDAVDRAHPHEPHWYLAVLGVDPSMQGRGLGRALLEPVLDRCDEQFEPAYLETQKPDNLPFYERFGFRVVGEVSVAGSPTMWRMWRDPDPDRLTGDPLDREPQNSR